MDTSDVHHLRLTRRGALAASAGAAGAFAFASRADAQTAAAACSLTPEQEQGPYYVVGPHFRRDIRSGKAGIPMQLAITVIDSRSCKPLRAAAVDIWHADALGTYSSGGGGALRGVQLTDAAGRAQFTSIFPGWYPNRTIHIHVKVREGGKAGTVYSGGHTSHTGNIFFTEPVSRTVEKLSPYRSNTVTRVLLTDDMVYAGQNGNRVVSRATPLVSGSPAKGYRVAIALAIDPASTPALVGIH